MGVVLAGKGKMLASMIEGCVNSGIKISGVLRYETVNSSWYKRTLSEIFLNCPDKILLKKYNIPDIKVKSINSHKFKEFLLKNNVSILIVGTWSEKISEEIYKMPVLASVNIHPSLLPKYRGPNPYLEAILHGETESGVTFHLIDKNFDTGAILYQEKFAISTFDTSEDLRNKAIFLVKKMIPDVIFNIQNGLIIPVKQNENIASYYKLRQFDNIINFKTQTPDEISRKIRALHPWIPCYIKLNFGLYFKINPKKFAITENSKNCLIGKIINKKLAYNSLKIVCKDKKIIEMSDLKLYPKIFSPLTKIAMIIFGK